MPKLSFPVLRGFGLAALFLAAALLGIAGGVLFAFTGDLPKISALDNYNPGITTRVLGRDGSVIGEFATERRDLVAYDQIPAVLRNAVVSAEDAGFFSHGGFSVTSCGEAAIRDLVHMRYAFGCSTLTMQLARKLFLTDEKGLERKAREAILTVQIEKRYTKREIFAMYCNKMYFGSTAYGVEAASEIYFGKHVGEVNLDEAATIAGIVQGNDRESPYRNMKAAVARRNYTLERMAANGYISATDAAAAEKRPIALHGLPPGPRSSAPYFLEDVRLKLEDKFGKEAVWQGGLTVKTGLDPELQATATKALDAQLRAVDKLRGFRKPHSIFADGKIVETYKNARWAKDFAVDDIVPAVVLGVDKGSIVLEAGKWTGTIDNAGYKWTGRKADAVVKRGDLVDVQLKKLDPKALTFSASLEQQPELEGAVIALNNHTGEIMAMIGGRSFEKTQFNRATQALRQVGSLFKPFVYTAAIDSGAYTEESIIQDEPTSFFAGPNQPPYEPKNFDRKFEGPVTLIHALEDSRNVPTVALMQALDPHKVVPYAEKMGITSPIPPYLSTAIGTAEATLIEMASAYTAWPNQGIRMTPVYIDEVTDRQGNVLQTSHPEPHDVLRADTAYVMTTMLHGVVMNGTAKYGAASISGDWPLGGKTGTTQDFTDAWFIGFDPDITVGVWVGFDAKKQIGPDAEGASTALPVWTAIMKDWIGRQKKALAETPVFPKPDNVVVVFSPTGPEAYIAGTEPGRDDARSGG